MSNKHLKNIFKNKGEVLDEKFVKEKLTESENSREIVTIKENIANNQLLEEAKKEVKAKKKLKKLYQHINDNQKELDYCKNEKKKDKKKKKDKNICNSIYSELEFEKDKLNEINYLKNQDTKGISHNSIVWKIISEKEVIFNNYLMKYNDDYGYFDKLDNHRARVFIYSKIPECGLKVIKDYDIVSILNLLKIHPAIQVYNDNDDRNKKLINCKNCVLKIRKNKEIEIKEHSKRYLFLNFINARYLEDNEYDFENSRFRSFIESLANNDEELMRLIRQVMGYCFSNLNNAKKAFIFYGKSNTGKSVLLNLLIKICGENNVSNIELQNLNKRENIATLYGKKLNVCNELPDYKMTDTGIFKALVSDNDKVTGKALYNNPFSFYNKAKLVFACNNMPSLNSNKSLDYEAFFNRLIIIPCLNSTPSHKQDKNLFKKLLKEKDLIFTWAMGGLQEYIDNENQFIEPKLTKKFMREYVSSVSMVDSFIKERCKYKDSEYSFKYEVEELFIDYYGYQKETMPKESELRELIEKLKKDYLYKRINRNGENKYGFLNLKLLP
ncbi:DNA primase family protein [Clostridium perfringens]